MKTIFTLLLTLAATFTTAHAEKTQPEIFRLSQFVFDPPASWRWLHSGGQSATGVVFKVSDPSAKESGRVVAMHYPADERLGDYKSTLSRWKKQFTEEPTCRTNLVKIGSHEVTYVEMKGSLKPEKTEYLPQPNGMLLGAVIKNNDGNVLVRMNAPKSLAEKSKADFKKMVEGALKKKQAK